MKLILAYKVFKLRSISLLLFLGFIGCLTPIDFPVEIAGGRLVVSGQISTLSEQNFIQLGTTAKIMRLPFPVSGAAITLLDDVGNSFSYTEDSSRPGTYLLPNVSGIPGRTYHIEIILDNNKVYKSLPEKMPEAVPFDNAYYEIVKEDVVDAEGVVSSKNFVKIFANTDFKESSKSPYLKWGIQEAFLLSPTDFPDPFGSVPPPCFVVQNADPQRVTLIDGSSIASTSIQGLLVGSRVVDWTFLERHYFTIYQSSISAESYQYWNKVNILANQVGSIFDTPPAEITGNIERVNTLGEKTLGFFQATNQSYKRFFLLQVNLPFPLLVEKCDFDGSFNPLDYPSRCIDCTSVPNSSFIRPTWF